MKKFAAIFAAAVLVVTLFASADKTNVRDEASENTSISSGITDL